MILILLMNALFAITFPVGKYALAYSSPTFLTALRMLSAGVILLTFLCLSSSGFSFPRARDRKLFFITSLFYTVFAFIPEFWALQYLSALKTNLLWSSQPFIAALLGYLFLRERLSYAKIGALIIGLLGLIPIMLVPDQVSGLLGGSSFITLPELALFFAVFSTVYAWFLVKKLQERGYSLLEINGYTMSFGGIICLALSCAQSTLTGSIEYTAFFPALSYALLLVGISNVGAYMIYGYLLRKYSVTLLSFSGFTCPVFGMLMSYFITNDPLYPGYLIGFSAILIGLYIFYREESRDSLI